jgi:hypothetical protein
MTATTAMPDAERTGLARRLWGTKGGAGGERRRKTDGGPSPFSLSLSLSLSPGQQLVARLFRHRRNDVDQLGRLIEAVAFGDLKEGGGGVAR